MEPTLHNKKPITKHPFFIPSVIIILAAIALGTFALQRINSTSSPRQAVMSDKRTSVNEALAKLKVNKEFSFPLKDANNKEVSKIKYMIENAEERDEIVVKGTPAVAVKGKLFLILNVKITNSYTKAVQINARDYVRLSVNKSEEKLAPEIHNDPVEVQAISTKYTRLGFTINDTDKNLVLHVGEITGPKSDIPVKF